MEEQIFSFFEKAQSEQVKPFLNLLISRNFDSFDTFSSYLEQCQPTLSCNENWLSENLIASCRNCGLFENSCIYIRCLLDGNHIQEKHQIYLQFGESGSCDCGQSASWDPKGFCKKHQGQHGNPEESLPDEIRENFKNIFEALKKFLTQEIERKDFHFFNEILEFITDVSEMGDGVRRLASICFGEDTFIQLILDNCYFLSNAQSDSLSSFISSYVNDESFSLQFARVVLPYCKVLIKKSLDASHVQEVIVDNPPIVSPRSIISLIFHVFHEFTIEKNVIDFNKFYEDLMLISFEFIRSNPTIFEGKNANTFLGHFWASKLVLQYYIKKNMIEECKFLFTNLSSLCSQIEGYIQPIQIINRFDDDSSYYDYALCHNFTFEFSVFPYELAKKLPYFSEIVEIFVDFLFKNDDIDHISFLFLTHKFAIATLRNVNKPKEEFDRIIEKHPMYSAMNEKIKNKEKGYENYKSVNELIYFRASLIPINVISYIMLRDLELLNKEEYPASLLDSLNRYKITNYAHIDLPFLLYMIQFMFSFTEDKNQYLRMIENHFSVFYPKNSESKAQRMFCFIVIVSSLICLDPKLIGKKKEITQLLLMTILKSNPNTPANVLSFYSAQTELNRAMKWYKEVKFENNWHIIIPFISPQQLLKDFLPNILHDITIKSSQSKIEKNKNKPNNNSILLPFPDFVDSDIIDLRSMMKSTYLYAVIYDIMYDTKEPLLLHYALNLFILLYNNEQIKNPTEQTEEHRINALTVDEIAQQIPDNFIEFCNVKINYKRGGSYISLIDLIEDLGPLGLNVLNRVIHKRNKKEMKRIMKLKSNIKTIKSRIIKTYKKATLNFNYMTVNNMATDIKLKPNDKMFIMVNLTISTVPDFLESRCNFNFPIKNAEEDDENEEEDDNEDKKLSFSFMKKRDHLKKCFIANTCGHFSEIKSYGQFCPRCNSFFNFYLPNLNVMDDSNSYYDNIIMRFFANFKKGFKLIKNMIIILDFRSRLKPEVLQDEMTFLLYRNMFILSQKFLQGVNPSLFTNRKSKLGIFLHDFIFTYNSNSDDFIQNFVPNYVEKLNYNIDYEFLKRVELIRLFFLSKELEFIVDIDEHFSFKNLIKMYQIPTDKIVPTKYTKYQFYKAILDTDSTKEDIENTEVVFDINEEQLPAFRGIDLPENFLQIINEPFNIELTLRKGEEKIICLATGEILNRNYIRQNMPIPRELNYQPVLIADGPRINATGIWSPNYFTFHDGIYRNEKGDEDIGFANGDPVFLDHERYINLIDSFISGICTKRIQNERAEVI